MGKISVIINVIQAEIVDLPRALASVKPFASEIVIIDMTLPGSGVTKIAEKYNAIVYRHPFVNYVEPVRNFGNSKASHEWILIVDPDEVIEKSLATKLVNIAAKPGASYFRIPRKKYTIW